MVKPLPGTMPPVPARPPRREPSQLDRIEAKLDALIAALADEHDDTGETLHDLEGDVFGRARDPGAEL